MHKVEKDLKIIEEILSKSFAEEKYYIVDFVPFTFPNEDYGILEEYLDKNYKKQFSKKIIFLLYSLMFYYDSHLYLEWEVQEPPFPQFYRKDLRNYDLEKLDKLVSHYILENYDGIYLLFKNSENTYSVMHIEGGYDIQFFGINAKTKRYVKDLIKSQGLFLKEIIPDPKDLELFNLADSAAEYIKLKEEYDKLKNESN